MNYGKEGQVRQKTASALRSVEQAKASFLKEKNKGTDSEAIINKEFEPFTYREVVPLLHETIISALPNERHNPEQAELYKAFAAGDVKKVMEIPREQRKQVFITGISVNFTHDLEGEKFGGADVWRRSRGSEAGSDDGGMGEYEYAMMMEAEMGMGRGMYNEYSPMGYMGGAATTEEKYSGFVVQVLCYSPYGRNITELGKLVDPPNVEDRKDKWGFVTRLKHLDEMVEDANSPFELFKKEDSEQFKLEIKEITIDGEMPEGIGIWEELIDETTKTSPGSNIMKREWILIDPMTRETINKVSVVDEDGEPVLYRGNPVYKVNDHWFVLNVKFVWRDAPEAPAQPVPSQYGMPSMPRPGAGAGSPGGSLPGIE
jgi:hypothetical protein